MSAPQSVVRTTARRARETFARPCALAGACVKATAQAAASKIAVVLVITVSAGIHFLAAK
jgi:hypothetical protein